MIELKRVIELKGVIELSENANGLTCFLWASTLDPALAGNLKMRQYLSGIECDNNSPSISETNCSALEVAASNVVNSANSFSLSSYPYLAAMARTSSSLTMTPLYQSIPQAMISGKLMRYLRCWGNGKERHYERL